MTPSKPRLVGLPGGLAGGKSQVSETLLLLGAPVIDADRISRALTAPGGAALPAIRQAFGSGVFPGEALDRALLADAVFGKKAQLERLNAILHPLVFEEMERQIAQAAGLSAVILDVPLLYETGFDRRCAEVWCVWAPRRMQEQRLLARGMTVKEARLRIESQMPADEKARRADRVILTIGDKQDSAQAARSLWYGMMRRVALG